MEPPVTQNPMPASLPGLPTDHLSKLFGIVYIILTGVINTIIPAAGPWSWVRKSFSDLFKLAPLLWWSLSAKNLAHIIPENDKPAAQAWIPESCVQEQPLHNLEDLAHTENECFVLAFTAKTFSFFFGVPSQYVGDINPVGLFALLVLSCLKTIDRTTEKCGPHFTEFAWLAAQKI
ncbi:hypothetical protein DSO57_1012509 [Entomophthora muscae]|uniref:Uncharacterized protein n=1 Tax=Entomophthora muscae TaxID=34485 RepID=A0ACC2T670_9FUNG|nr:hypothetical protein DSO57_1012509 [Entomophthora muscae]